MNWRIVISLILLLVGLPMFLAYAPEVDRHVAVNTFFLGAMVNLIAVPLGLCLAMTCLSKNWLGKFTLASCLALLFVPLFVHVSAWDAAFGKLGWLTGLSANTGFSLSPWTMAILIHSLAAIPQISIIIWLGMLSSGRVHEQHASLDASAASVFWHITVPKMMPLIGLAVAWNFVVCAREIAVTDIYRIGTLAEQIYLGYSLGDFDSMSNQMTNWLVMGALACLTFVLVGPSANSSGNSRDVLVNGGSSKPPRWVGLITPLVLLAMLVIPTLNLLTRASRKVDIIDGSPIVSYSAGNLVDVVARVPSVFADEFCWSALIATVSTISLMTIGVLWMWVARKSTVSRILLLLVFSIVGSLPGPLIGSSLLELRNFVSYPSVHWLFDRTIFAPVLANSIFCFPISVLFAWYIIHNIPRDMEQSMAVEGAGPWTRLYQLVFKANWKLLLGSMVIVFATCLGELSATQLAVPPGMDTLPRRMLGLLHSGVNDHTAGLTIVSVSLVMLLVSLGYCLFGWKRRKLSE